MHCSAETRLFVCCWEEEEGIKKKKKGNTLPPTSQALFLACPRRRSPCPGLAVAVQTKLCGKREASMPAALGKPRDGGTEVKYLPVVRGHLPREARSHRAPAGLRGRGSERWGAGGARGAAPRPSAPRKLLLRQRGNHRPCQPQLCKMKPSVINIAQRPRRMPGGGTGGPPPPSVPRRLRAGERCAGMAGGKPRAYGPLITPPSPPRGCGGVWGKETGPCSGISARITLRK